MVASGAAFAESRDVARIFGRMTRWHRLVSDYEARIDVSDAMIHGAMGSLLPRRISH